MSIINKYLIKQLLIFFSLIAVTLVGIDLIFSLINELRFLGRGDYSGWVLIQYLILTLSRKLYLLLPWIAFFSVYLSFNQLARQYEIIVLQSMGWSLFRFMSLVLKFGLVLVLIFFVIGEIIGPYTDRAAQRIKTLALSHGQVLSTSTGIWLRQNDQFINIGEKIIDTDGDKPVKLNNLRIYNLAVDQSRIEQIWHIGSALATNVAGQWQCENVNKYIINNDNIKLEAVPSLVLNNFIQADILDLVRIKHLDTLSLLELNKIIKVNKINHIDSKEYEFYFWSKCLRPIMILLMMLIVIPLGLSNPRSTNFAMQFGITLGLGFVIFMFYEISPSFFAKLLGFNALAAASAPLVFNFILLWLCCRWVR